jgi:hypothetical protein
MPQNATRNGHPGSQSQDQKKKGKKSSMSKWEEADYISKVVSNPNYAYMIGGLPDRCNDEEYNGDPFYKAYINKLQKEKTLYEI